MKQKTFLDKVFDFLSSFSNSGVIVLLIGFLIIFNKQSNRISDLQTLIETDSIFTTYVLTDTTGGISKDTTITVTNMDLLKTVVNLNQDVPVQKELVKFANWAIPVVDQYIKTDKPVHEGILCSTWIDWNTDQKALAAEKAGVKTE